MPGHIDKSKKMHVDARGNRYERIQKCGINFRKTTECKDPVERKQDRQLRKEEPDACERMHTPLSIQCEYRLRLFLAVILVFLFQLFDVRSYLSHCHLRFDGSP